MHKGTTPSDVNTTNPHFLHEYGHYMQSESVGVPWILIYGVPSIIAYLKDKDNWVERDADSRGFKLYTGENWPSDYSKHSIWTLWDP